MEVHEFKIKRKVLTDEVFTVGVDAESRDEAIKLLKGIINNTEEDLANQLYNNMYAKEDRIYVYDAEAVQSDGVLRELTVEENNGLPVRTLLDSCTEKEIE